MQTLDSTTISFMTGRVRVLSGEYQGQTGIICGKHSSRWCIHLDGMPEGERIPFAEDALEPAGKRMKLGTTIVHGRRIPVYRGITSTGVVICVAPITFNANRDLPEPELFDADGWLQHVDGECVFTK